MLLQNIWFFLWGLLWAMFFMLDGYDLGSGTLLPFVSKTDSERQLVLTAQGPFWDGNEVWLIAAGGVTFAAFPTVYASMFSGLYTALMLLLFALILRAVSFEFRSKVETPSWRKLWDTMHFLGSALPPILLGVAFANIFRGLPINADGQIQATLIDLLNPYGLAGGLFFLVLFAMHGAIWLSVRTFGAVRERAEHAAKALWPIVLVITVGFLFMSAAQTNLFANYLATPLLFVVLALAVVCLAATRWFMGLHRWWAAFGTSALTIVAVTFFGVIGIYPALLPSRLNPEWSLTAFNASSSQLTLQIMLTVVCIFVPIVLAYQLWVHIKFGGRLSEEDIHY